MTSELKVDKITPASGTNTQIGEAGDTTNLSAGTVTLPTSIITGASEKTTLVDADKFLISDSADSNAFKHVQKSNLPSSDFIRIATSRSSSNTAAVNFDNVFDGSVYEHYRVFGYVCAAVNSGGDMYWRTGCASGSTYTSSNYIWVQDGRYIDNGGSQGDYHVGTYNDSKFRYATAMKVDGDSGYALFDFLLSDPTTNQMSRSYITGTVSWMENTGYQQVTTSFGARNDANVNATGLRFQQESNNIAYHHIQIWGYKKS